MANKQNFTILTPHTSIIIWNYADRLGTDDLRIKPEVDQVILNTVSLRSISTQKTKASASGSFEIRLAPTKNWVSLLTPGSWMAILMSRKPISKKDLKVSADPEKVKWFGRVDAVRVSVAVDQATGTRQTEYIVTGVDWADVFNSTLYIDSGLGGDEREKSSVGHAAQLAYTHQLNLIKGNLPSTSQNIQALLKIWGDPGPTVSAELKAKSGFITKPVVEFTIPQEVANYFKFLGGTSRKIAELIKIEPGVLEKLDPKDEYEDSYKEVGESIGVILPGDIVGSHDMWSVMAGQSNNVLNEMVADLRWSKGIPSLALYKRIRPFVNNEADVSKDGQYVGDGKGTNGAKSFAKLISHFKNIRRIRIPVHEIVSFNAGTNWRDKLNFIEVQLNRGADSRVINPQVKVEAQFYDEIAFGREGLRPMIAQSRQFPSDGKNEGGILTIDLKELFAWKYLLKEWYFNSHRMLNGSIVFPGQDKYIQVGDNLITEALILGPSYNTNTATVKKRDKAYLTMHVESISHNFQVSPSGVREWFTTVQFVRGVLTDTNGKFLSSYEGFMEQDVTKVGIEQELNNANTITTSANKDPD